ncbi:MAG: hypothetical protein IJX55_05630, partial [Clostridia bacterium]|nr:hypothetical protein [Clostridia bacterium]
EADKMSVYISARKCTYIGERAPQALQYDDMRYFAFSPENDGTLPPVSVVEIGGACCTVHWAEIEII